MSMKSWQEERHLLRSIGKPILNYGKELIGNFRWDNHPARVEDSIKHIKKIGSKRTQSKTGKTFELYYVPSKHTNFDLGKYKIYHGTDLIAIYSCMNREFMYISPYNPDKPIYHSLQKLLLGRVKTRSVWPVATVKNLNSRFINPGKFDE